MLEECWRFVFLELVKRKVEKCGLRRGEETEEAIRTVGIEGVLYVNGKASFTLSASCHRCWEEI